MSRGYAEGRIDEYFNDRLDCRGARLLDRSRVADATVMACSAMKRHDEIGEERVSLLEK